MELTKEQRLQRSIAGLIAAQKLGPEGCEKRAAKGGNGCLKKLGVNHYKLMRAKQLLAAEQKKNRNEKRASGKARSQSNPKD